MNPDASLRLHGPRDPRVAVVLDSPHSGTLFPAGFDAVVTEFDLRDAEDCFVDELYLPATELGVPLLAAQFARTVIDANRSAADIDAELLDAPWPYDYAPSGKAAIGKALVWRTLDDGRPIYGRRLRVAEVVERIERIHRPYHRALAALLERTHARFGVVVHVNCHSMNAVAGAMGEGRAGAERADFVLGDRDGTTCDPRLTQLAGEVLAALGYRVGVNDPFKGVELVRAYSNPAQGRHSLQVEVNKRLYMDEATRTRHGGFERVQRDLAQLVAAIAGFAEGARA
jgi:N-formylglutamate amidohydrolase